LNRTMHGKLLFFILACTFLHFFDIFAIKNGHFNYIK
jgi:hypothetical protein